MSGTQLALVGCDSFMAADTDDGVSVNFDKQSVDVILPVGESFLADNRNDVVGVHLVSWEKLSALRTSVELTLSSSARIDAITHAGFSDGFIFWSPA